MEKAVRWSSHYTGDRKRFLIVDVVDSSLTLNEVENFHDNSLRSRPIACYNKLPNFGAFDWSKNHESIVALGLTSGNAVVVKLNEHKKPSETISTFRIKQQRKCNSIAFSTQAWLAVGLDKTRSDVCLNVYDSASPRHEPVHRLCAAELVSSVRFFPSQPQELIASVQRSYIRVYDLRDGYFGSGSSLSTSTRNVNNIAIDPLDQNYFASAGSTDDPSVTIWDRRWITQSSSGGSNTGAVLEFRPAVDSSMKTTVWSLRYSGQQRGRLALCSSVGELKVIDMVEGCATHAFGSNYLPNNLYGGTSWSCNRYVSETRSLEHAYHHTRYGRKVSDRIIAFDWVRNGDDVSGQAIICLRPDREAELLRMPCNKPKTSITAREDLSLAFSSISVTEAEPSSETVKPSAPYEQVHGADAAEDFGPLDYSGELTAEDGYDEPALRYLPGDQMLGRLLAPATIYRERCRSGYLWDCKRNAATVAGNWQLERLWEIIGRFQQQASGDGMVHDSLDLSYVGVSGLWSEHPGPSPNRRLSPSPMKTSDAIVGLNESKEIPAFEGERTNFPEHRQLCLAVCGWKFTTDTLEEECNELIDKGLYYQAIVQAVLHDYKHIALNLLRTMIRSKTIPNIGLGALLACDVLNEEQREMCLWMAADTEDPALKALLTFLNTGNWRDVMKTNYLHLGYRVALGLKYLNDTELSGFIQTETARAVKNGDLEGILLTGLSEQSMDLFQTYITRTNDLQTAVLATAFTNPLYVDDVRWEMWKQTYFDQMQSWRAFIERSRFVVQHNRMAKTRDGRPLVKFPPKQIALQCTHCHGSLAREDGSRSLPGKPGKRTKSTTSTGTAASAGVLCPQCGRHMPRCAICMMWLGTSESSRTKSAKGSPTLDNNMAKFVSFCVSCGHGYHADHAVSWFKKHSVCAKPDCQCLCGLKK